MTEFCKNNCRWHTWRVVERSGTGDVGQVLCGLHKKGTEPILEVADQVVVDHFSAMDEFELDADYSSLGRFCIAPRT